VCKRIVGRVGASSGEATSCHPLSTSSKFHDARVNPLDRMVPSRSFARPSILVICHQPKRWVSTTLAAQRKRQIGVRDGSISKEHGLREFYNEKAGPGLMAYSDGTVAGTPVDIIGRLWTEEVIPLRSFRVTNMGQPCAVWGGWQLPPTSKTINRRPGKRFDCSLTALSLERRGQAPNGTAISSGRSISAGTTSGTRVPAVFSPTASWELAKDEV
jgi:hypothetical protein